MTSEVTPISLWFLDPYIHILGIKYPVTVISLGNILHPGVWYLIFSDYYLTPGLQLYHLKAVALLSEADSF